MKRLYCFFAAFFLLAQLAGPVQSQTDEVRRDLEILQDVLSRLLQGENTSFFSTSGTRGVYIPGFGMLIHANYGGGGLNLGVPIAPPVINKKETEAALDRHRRISESDSAIAAQQVKATAEVKKQLTRFFTDYAAGARSLPAQENITVVVDLQRSSFVFRAKNSGGQIMAAVAKSKLAQLRQDSDPAALISFQIKNSDQEKDQEMEIFCDLLNKTLMKKGPMMEFSKDCRPIYLADFGVVLMQNAAFAGVPFAVSTGLAEVKAVAAAEKAAALAEKAAAEAERIAALEEKEAVEVERAAREAEREAARAEKSTAIAVKDLEREVNQKSQQQLQEMRENIIDLLSRYGGSLRSLKPEQQLVIVVDLNSHFGRDAIKSMIFRARMADVQKVFSGEMSAAAFKSAVTVTEVK